MEENLRGIPVAVLNALPYVHHLLRPWVQLVEHVFVNQVKPSRGKRAAKLELFVVGAIEPQELRDHIVSLHWEIRCPLFELYVYGGDEWKDSMQAPAMARWVSELTPVNLGEGAGELTPRSLLQRYPYMFDPVHWEIGIAKGWFSLFERACADIDQLLGSDRYRFKWIQVKEKFGTLRAHFVLGRRRPGARSVGTHSVEFAGQAPLRKRRELFEAILAIRIKATAQSAQTCMVCGQPGREHRRLADHWALTLCDTHIAQDLAGDPLPSVWFSLDDEPWFVAMAQLDFS